MTQTSTIFFCPECTSPAVDTSPLVGGSAKCRKCGWTGTHLDLLTREVSGPGPEALIAAFSNDLKLLLARNVVLPLGQLLQKWGFLSFKDPDAQQVFARYMNAVTVALVRAIFEQRDKEAGEASSKEPS